MIPVLQYHKLELLDKLMLDGRKVFASYEIRDYYFDDQLKQWLQHCDQFFEQHNGPVERSKMKTLFTDFATLLRGTDPYSFEKIERNKRAHELTIGYRIAREALQVLMDYYQLVYNRLEESKNLIGQMVLAMLQAGIITTNDIQKMTTQKHSETLWQKMAKDNQLLLVQQKVLLQTSKYDAIILLGLVLTALRNK